MNKIATLIQHNHVNAGKMVLQALIPFIDLKDRVLFTCKANPNHYPDENYSLVAQDNFKYYQRRIDEKRLSKIECYIRQSILSESKGYSITALFPSALILAVGEDDGNEVEPMDNGNCNLTLSRNIFIVDGQHRMMAMKILYSKLKSALFLTPDDNAVLKYLETYKFNCVVLVNYDLWEQGQVFVNVNFNQKSVNKSLYYEVFGSKYNEDPSSWKQNHIYLAHNLAKVLNENQSSPYYNQIKMIGTGKGYISQAFVVEALIRHFSLNGIWSIYKTNRKEEGDVRYMAVEVLSFFSAVRDSFASFWPQKGNDKGTIICKTTGTGAFVRLMADVHESASEDVIKSLFVDKIEVSKKFFDFTKLLLERIPIQKRTALFGDESKYAGSSGKGSETKLYKELKSLIFNRQLFEVGQDSSIPVDDIAEELQEYLWTHVESDLDCLGYRYEYDELSGLVVEDYDKNGESLRCSVKFNSGVTIYIDNEDETGFSMCLPSKASLEMLKKDGKWELVESSVKTAFDTSNY